MPLYGQWMRPRILFSGTPSRQRISAGIGSPARLLITVTPLRMPRKQFFLLELHARVSAHGLTGLGISDVKQIRKVAGVLFFIFENVLDHDARGGIIAAEVPDHLMIDI